MLPRLGSRSPSRLRLAGVLAVSTLTTLSALLPVGLPAQTISPAPGSGSSAASPMLAPIGAAVVSGLGSAIARDTTKNAGLGDSIMQAVRAGRWDAAAAAAARDVDPVARKLVTFYRLLTPGAARATEIAAFMAQNPDWPEQRLLSKRLQEALATDRDDRAVLLICRNKPVTAVPSLLRCADASAAAGQGQDANAAARAAWISGNFDPLAERGFLRRWGRVIGPEDEWRRFDRLAWSDPAAAARQLPRLDAAHRAAAVARLALRRDDPKALRDLAALPPEMRGDPTMILEEARWLRRNGAAGMAVSIWNSYGAVAERDAPPDRRAAFWTERDLLARDRLAAGDPVGAYRLADDQAGTEPEARADADFLAGWIALRRLHDPATAARHFRDLATVSKAAITQGRAHYWLARAAAAAADPATAHTEYLAAARWPTTYYGQLAARALGDDDAAIAARLLAVRDPVWQPQQALAFAGGELARAAEHLVGWGEPRRARIFLLRLDLLARSDTERSLAANLALTLGLPDEAVVIARLAGRDGLMLPEAGWPAAVAPPDGVDPVLALALIRQESNFDPEAASPVGARGLMQLMPGTAEIVARRLGGIAAGGLLLTDPELNMRLGTSYLRSLLDHFDGVLPYAVAAYNAGPSRVASWIAANGDPAAAHGETAGGNDMIDWIELIPIGETRNYVQRVIENAVIYRVRRSAL